MGSQALVCIRQKCWYCCWHQPGDESAMPTNQLSDAAIRALRAKGAKYRKADGGGLYLQVEPTGSRLWRLAYRFGGKQKTLAIGVYPSVSLLEARAARDDAKAKLRGGLDPGEARRLEKAK